MGAIKTGTPFECGDLGYRLAKSKTSNFVEGFAKLQGWSSCRVQLAAEAPSKTETQRGESSAALSAFSAPLR